MCVCVHPHTAEQGLFSPQRGGPAATPARTPRPAAAGAADRTPAPAARPDPSKDSEALWVAKYAPKRFMNLLSDEQTNRCDPLSMSWPLCVSQIVEPQMRLRVALV